MSVYVVTDGNGSIKIGAASDVEKRVAQLQAGNPNELEILRAYETYGTRLTDYELEHTLHYVFQRHRIETAWIQTEWFKNISLADVDNAVNDILQGALPNAATFRNHSNTETIGALRTEIDGLRRQNQRLTAENRNKRNEIKALKAELAKASRNAAEAVNKIVCLSQEKRRARP